MLATPDPALLFDFVPGPLTTSTDVSFDNVSLHSALLQVAQVKGLTASALESWNRASRLLLEPAGLNTVGDLLSLPAQDVDEDLLANNDSAAQRAKHLRELALPHGVLRALVHMRAGHHDETLRGLATTLAKRQPPASPFVEAEETAATAEAETAEDETSPQAAQ